MNNINDALKRRIKELLKLKDMTLYRLAMNSGVSPSTLGNIMKSRVNNNLLSTTILIAGGFDMTVSEFLDSTLFLEDNLKI